MSAGKPTQYQEDGIEFLRTRKRALLADDTGLGKTLEMIVAANRLQRPTADRIIVFCPKIAVISWQIELEKWGGTSAPFPHNGPWRAVRVLRPTFEVLPNGPLVLIVPFSKLTKHSLTVLKNTLAKSAPFGVAIIDEAHGVKDPTTQRTAILYGRNLDLQGGLLENVQYRWLATATPTPLGHVGELYAHLRALFPDVLLKLFGGGIPNQTTFEDRFCNVKETKFGRKIEGNKPEARRLSEALAPFILRRMKPDVMAELPPLLTMPLPVDTGGLQIVPDPQELEEIMSLSDEDLIARLIERANQNAAPSILRDLGERKLDAVLPWVLDFLASAPERKMLIFAHHRAVIDRLCGLLFEANLNPVRIYGGTTQEERDRAVTYFQNDPTTRVFVGQTVAAGVAITLTAADTVMLLEPHPSPDMNYQAISRAYRMGQQNPVLAIIPYGHADPLQRRHVKILQSRAQGNADFFQSNDPLGAVGLGHTTNKKL